MTSQLIDATLRATVVLAAAWIATRILGRASADIRHRIWLAALMIVALLLIPVPVPDQMRVEIVSGARAAGIGSASNNWPSLLLIAWAAGMILLLVRQGAGLARMARLTRRARRPDGDPILISDEITTPMTWGAFRAAILVPAYMEQWPAAKRAAVVLHERAHIARRDWMWQMFAHGVTAVFWFHPLVWVAATRLRFEAERAADDRVLAEGVSAADYADRLVEVARQIRREGGMFSAALSGVSIAMVEPSALPSRIDAILDSARSHARASLAHRAAVLMASMLLFLSLAAAQNLEVYKVTDLSVPPRVASKVEPKYTRQARAAKIQGKVVLTMVIKADGRADQIHVAQSLDKGLDANAITAIRKWHFEPGKKDGKAVPVAATIEVNFKLL